MMIVIPTPVAARTAATTGRSRLKCRVTVMLPSSRASWLGLKFRNDPAFTSSQQRRSYNLDQIR